MTSEAERVVRAYFDQMWNAHDLSAFPRFVAPDVRYHPPRGAAKDFEAYRRMAELFFTGFPDLRFDVEELVEARGLVALRIRITGTHKGDWRGARATGKRMDVQGRPWLRVRDGKVVEVWSLFDELGAMQQLGAAPVELGAH